MLGVDVVVTESYDSWLAFLRKISDRGVGGAELVVSQVFLGHDVATVTVMYYVARDMLEGCCPRAAAILEVVEPDALAYLDFPPSHWKRLRAINVQERTNREIKRRLRVVQALPSTTSPVRLAGAVMFEQDEMRQESRYFSEAKMGELYDKGRTRGTGGRSTGRG